MAMGYRDATSPTSMWMLSHTSSTMRSLSSSLRDLQPDVSQRNEKRGGRLPENQAVRSGKTTWRSRQPQQHRCQILASQPCWLNSMRVKRSAIPMNDPKGYQEKNPDWITEGILSDNKGQITMKGESELKFNQGGINGKATVKGKMHKKAGQIPV